MPIRQRGTLASRRSNRYRKIAASCTVAAIATIGIDIGRNTFHLVGLDQRANIVLQLRTSREHEAPTRRR